MKKLIIFIFLLSGVQLLAQIYPNPVSPARMGNLNLQNGKVFYQHVFPGISLPLLAERLKSKEQVYSVFNLNEVTPSGIKGTITDFQLSIDQYGLKRKKLAPFLASPLNAIFQIDRVDGQNRVTIGSIWFRNPDVNSGLSHQNIERLITDKNSTVFRKDKKHLISIAILEKNLEELFRTASGGSGL